MNRHVLPITAGPSATGWADSPRSPRRPWETDDAVLRVLLERAAAGSRPGERRDRHVVCLALGGGGMRGSVSAGMCVALEAAGLVPAFDRVYGCSAGAMNGAFTAASQAGLGATVYKESASRLFIDARRLVRGRPAVDLELIFDELLARKRPFGSAGLAKGPDFRALAVSPGLGELRVLSDLRDPDEVLGAVRAGCSVPLLDGASPSFRGERLVDGGFLESIPTADSWSRSRTTRRCARVRRTCWFCVPAPPATGYRHTEGSPSWPSTHESGARSVAPSPARALQPGGRTP